MEGSLNGADGEMELLGGGKEREEETQQGVEDAGVKGTCE